MHLLDLDALKAQYQSTFELRTSMLMLEKEGLDLQIALVLRNVSQRLKNLSGAARVPAGLSSVLEQLIRISSLSSDKLIRRRRQVIRSQRAKFHTALRKLFA